MRYALAVARRAPLPRRLFDNITRLRRRLTSEMDGGLAVLMELELSLAQAMALLNLHERGPMTVGALQATIGRSQAATSHLVEQLAQRELVVRTADPEDRRRRLVEASEAGHETVRRIEAVRQRAVDRVFGKVPPAVLARFDAALADLLDALEG